jgi:hypothetical protein
MKIEKTLPNFLHCNKLQQENKLNNISTTEGMMAWDVDVFSVFVLTNNSKVLDFVEPISALSTSAVGTLMS